MFLVVQLMLVVVFARQTSGATKLDCQSLRSKADSSYRKRSDLKTRQRAEIDLKGALEECALSEPSKLERRLRTVQEEIAMTQLLVAEFYLKYSNGQVVKAALSRLQRIDNNYRNFSQMDRVLFMLGDLSDKDGTDDNAVRYFQRLIADYPRSSYAVQARERLAALSPVTPKHN